jgi:hypothetical protein
MIKLIRNFFGERLIFQNSNNDKIDFTYIKKLNELQENEGLHLDNKIRKELVNFFRPEMKTKLATQLLNISVVEALTFFRDVLKLEEFKSCGATVEFINLMNDAFDILNSRKLENRGFKRAVGKKISTELKNPMTRYMVT